MRPTAVNEIFQRPRKRSLVERTPPFAEALSAPTTFFLARGARAGSGSQTRSDDDKESSGNAQSLGGLMRPSRAEERNTVLDPAPSTASPPHQTSSASSNVEAANSQPLTPLFIPSPSGGSLPSSPKSCSAHSARQAELGLTTDDRENEAIISDDVEEDALEEEQNSSPQLIMPSIKMPSRRPFTSKGKEMGLGKTSLIKSMVQVCEDIVHIDPVPTGVSPSRHTKPASTTEIYASTKPYPPWWSDHDYGKGHRRRKSLGDSVLERNICFVDSTAKSLEQLLQYMHFQLQSSALSGNAACSHLIGVLSGWGGSQVDVVLYLLSKETLHIGLNEIKQLEELSVVIPLIAKSDLYTQDELADLRDTVNTGIKDTSIAAITLPNSNENEQLYTISSHNSPDIETMDASLLMSSEYVEPLIPSELMLLVERLFDKDNIAYLRHISAKRLLSYHSRHPNNSPKSSPSLDQSNITSPVSLSNSGVIVPYATDISLNTSNSHSLAMVADHTQQQEQLAQIRLSNWAAELQKSLQRERERFETLAKGERALWLVGKMGEELKDGRIVPFHGYSIPMKRPAQHPILYQGLSQDPLGLLRWKENLSDRGWFALQFVGSLGVVGGITYWIAKACGVSSWT
ncbi:MAG: hypothetical protein Q9227_007505 [Pyrenula ochraceoflavens]